MSFKKIEELAHKKHTKMILTSLVACMGLGFALSGTTLTSANDNAFMGAEFHEPSTKVAQETDLGESLSGHKVESNQFTHLLNSKFNITSDSDIVHTSDYSGGNNRIKLNRKYIFTDGLIKAKEPSSDPDFSDGHTYSDVSDVNGLGSNNSHVDTMTYFVTKHNLILREMFMEFNGKHSLRLVKYHLHSVAKGTSNIKALIFYPTEFQYKDSNIITIPKNKQSEYPMHLIVNSRKGSSPHTDDLLPK